MADIKEISVKVGSRIKYFRKLQGLSQESLALSAGLNPAFLGHLERGLKCPTVDTLNKIAVALKIPLSELVTFEDDTDSSKLALEKIKIILDNIPEDKLDKTVNIFSDIAGIVK